MKTKTLLKTSLFVLLLIILSFVFFYHAIKKNVLKAGFNEYYNSLYPPDCYVVFQNKKYLVREVYKYDNRILNEYWFLGSEGFAVEKLGINGNAYSKEQENYKFLNLEGAKEYVIFDSVKYKIDYTKGDTIISKIDLNDIVVFINKK